MKAYVSAALLGGLAIGAFMLSGCSTVSSRIKEDRAAFDQLPADQRALISQGRIGGGMSQEAVYIAWGQPQQKTVGMVRNVPTETWVYTASAAGYGPYYGAGWYGGYGFGGVRYVGRRGGHRVYAAFYDPLWDPFYYPFPPTIQYPIKTVSFQRGRVIAFQYLAPGV